MIKTRYFFFFIIGLCFLNQTHASTPLPKSLDWQLGLGHLYLFDGYLSPFPQEGGSFVLNLNSSKPLKWGLARDSEDPTKWFRQFNLSLNSAYAQPVAGSGMYYGNLDFKFNLLRQFTVNSRVNAAIGAYAALGGGGRYGLQESNNPGSLDAYTNVGTTLFSDFRFTPWNKTLKLTYQVRLALAGLAFSPEFAESYYEIFYLGNKKNVVKFIHPFNFQQWEQRLSLDIPFNGKQSCLRIGLQNDGRISLLNSIRTRILSNHVSVGYVYYFNTL